MPQTYFSNFNQIEYANNTVIDITERAVVQSTRNTTPDAYYPLELFTNPRADIISYSAYNDPYLSWAIYLTNNVVDPYYDWYLDEYQFTNFIKGKYGSLEAAQTKIKYWRNNWVDQPHISPERYESLSANQKQYWEPNIQDQYYSAIDYRRKQEDWIVTTNFVVEANLTLMLSTQSNTFFNGEIVTLEDGGTAQVIQQLNPTVNTNPISVVMQNINGTLTGNVVGKDSGAFAVVNEVVYLSNTIPSDTVAYWTPVYYYDYENEKNESKKSPYLIKPQLMPNFVQSIKTLLGS